MTRLDIPIIDLAPYFEGGQDGKQKVAADMNRACEGIGFFIITGPNSVPTGNSGSTTIRSSITNIYMS